MRISDWSSDVCSSDLGRPAGADQRHDRLAVERAGQHGAVFRRRQKTRPFDDGEPEQALRGIEPDRGRRDLGEPYQRPVGERAAVNHVRSEEHTSELQSLMRISYAVFCLKKKNKLT